MLWARCKGRRIYKRGREGKSQFTILGSLDEIVSMIEMLFSVSKVTKERYCALGPHALLSRQHLDCGIT
jgi:hypothetical protein